MSRSTTLTLGFFLLLIGLKLNFVQSYQLTPAATRFWIERIEDPEIIAKNGLQQYFQNNQYSSPFYQTSYNRPAVSNASLLPQKVVQPPTWVCWPVFFLGAFMLLHGMSLRRD